MLPRPDNLPPVVSAKSPLPQRSLSIPEQLDATVRLFRNHLWYLVPPVVLTLLPILLIEGALNITPSWNLFSFMETSSFGLFGAEGFFDDLITLQMWVLFNGLIVPLVNLWLHFNVQRYLCAYEPKAFPPFKPLAKAYATWLLTQGLIWVPVILFVVGASGITPYLERSGSSIGGTHEYFLPVLLLFGAFSFLWVIWQGITYLSPAISVATGYGPIKTIRFAIALFRRQWGLILVMYVMISVAVGLTTSVLTGIPVAFLSVPNDYLWATGAVGFVISSSVTIPIMAIASMVLLRDVMIRALGADIHDALDQLLGEGIYAKDPADRLGGNEQGETQPVPSQGGWQ